MLTTEQQPLWTELSDWTRALARRPKDWAHHGPAGKDKAEVHQVGPGAWVVAFWWPIPKTGWPESWHFAHCWGGPNDRITWSVSADGEIPEGAHQFASDQEALDALLQLIREQETGRG